MSPDPWTSSREDESGAATGGYAQEPPGVARLADLGEAPFPSALSAADERSAVDTDTDTGCECTITVGSGCDEAIRGVSVLV